jgi:hypothetical protein
VRYHHQNLTDGRLPLWRYGRAWWGALHWGWYCFHRTDLLLLSVRRWGFSVYLRGLFGFHFGVKDEDSDERGRWQVSWSDGSLRLEHPWCRQDGWDSRDPWWRNAIRLRFSDWIFGKWSYGGRVIETRDVLIPMPEGCYRAVAKHEIATWRRRFGIVWRRRDSWNIDIPGGIPFSGKGENSWDCGDDGLFGLGGGISVTLEERIGEIVASVLKSRSRHGHDAAGTGRVPLRIVNEKEGSTP